MDTPNEPIRLSCFQASLYGQILVPNSFRFFPHFSFRSFYYSVTICSIRCICDIVIIQQLLE